MLLPRVSAALYDCPVALAEVDRGLPSGFSRGDVEGPPQKRHQDRFTHEEDDLFEFSSRLAVVGARTALLLLLLALRILLVSVSQLLELPLIFSLQMRIDHLPRLHFPYKVAESQRLASL